MRYFLRNSKLGNEDLIPSHSCALPGGSDGFNSPKISSTRKQQPSNSPLFIGVAGNRYSKSLAKAANFFLKDSLILPPEPGQISVQDHSRICASIFLRRSASFSNNTFHAASRSDIPDTIRAKTKIDFLRIRGKTYDHKVLYRSIAWLFPLPKDDQHVLFILGLSTPIRPVSISGDAVHARRRPRFQSQPQGDLFLLERYIFFVSEQPTRIEINIHQVIFSRVGASAGASTGRTFDLKIVTQSGPEHNFTSINGDGLEITETSKASEKDAVSAAGSDVDEDDGKPKAKKGSDNDDAMDVVEDGAKADKTKPRPKPKLKPSASAASSSTKPKSTSKTMKNEDDDVMAGDDEDSPET
ncbi:hypothetical protein BYT27DRAFT_7260836 [Phlegmacium glaucopus]|nr:hypothetical protein BYT27DRAFT_7260836 [Phlegmacium glaucopus]